MQLDPVDIVRFGFVAGEISENYHFRSDLEKFDLALSVVRNYFVDYRGGLSSRPGTEFIDYLDVDTKDIILVPFRFASDIANTNMLVFSDFVLRIVQDGAYVLEDPFNITAASQAAAATITAAGNDFVVGDWVKVYDLEGMDDHNGQLYKVSVAGATVTLTDVYGNAIDSTSFPAYVTAGKIARVVKVDSPYSAEALRDLRFSQRRDNIRITSNQYVTRNLRRNSATSWTFTDEEQGEPQIDSPGNIVGTPPTASTFGCVYRVTAVDDAGNESIAYNRLIVTTAQNPVTTDAWTFTISWTGSPDAKYYKVYRSRIISSANSVDNGMEVGYIGKTYGTSFVDQFITPNFTMTPPVRRRPFANGTIQRVDVLTPGDGYSQGATLSASDPNPAATGFRALLVNSVLPSDNTRPIAGVIILDGGKNYTSPTFTVVNGGAGAGATFDAQVSPLSGNYPALSAIFQQRQLYFSTLNNPLGIEGSKPGLLSNFDQADLIQQDDAYSYELDSEDASAILHAIDTRGGMLLITASGIWQFSSGGSAAITPSNALAEPQTYKGATKLPPLKIDTSIIYAEPGAVKYLSYNDTNKLYSGSDISLLANHMFEIDNQMTSWAYADEPFRLIKACREDGQMLTCTLLRDQDVFAWTRYTTRGEFKYISSLQEDIVSTVYCIVERTINGQVRKYLEKFTNRMFKSVEDAFCVDAGLALGANYPDGTVVASGVDGDITLRSNAPLFSNADLNKAFRGGGGKGYVISVDSNMQVTVRMVEPIKLLSYESDPALPASMPSGEWTLDSPVTVLRGLRHLAGETVKVLADGQVHKLVVDANGRVTLPKEVTRAVAGFGYTCFAKTLPPVFSQEPVEGRRKRIVGLVARVKDSLALKVGTDLDRLYPAHERTNEHYGEPIKLQQGTKVSAIDGAWDEDAPVYFVQEDPLPTTILGYVVSTEIGDDKK